MKAIYCPACGDFQALRQHERNCECGKSWGRQAPDQARAIYGGQALPAKVQDISLSEAVRNRPVSGGGERFEAVIVPYADPLFVHEDTLAQAPWRKSAAFSLEGWA